MLPVYTSVEVDEALGTQSLVLRPLPQGVSGPRASHHAAPLGILWSSDPFLGVPVDPGPLTTPPLWSSDPFLRVPVDPGPLTTPPLRHGVVLGCCCEALMLTLLY
ncbi:unnamed protein product [Arctogadus glacialis]